MTVGSITVFSGNYGYCPGGRPSGGEATTAIGTATAEKPPEEESSSYFASRQTTQRASRSPASEEHLTPQEQKQVAQLQSRDREVRAHEAAHVAAGGGYVRGGANFSYQVGPDGKRYAVGGEVSIDTSPVRDNPAATIAKMQTVRRAALAPADPSAQDRAVAAAASASEAQARQELRDKQQAAGSAADGKRKNVTIHGSYYSTGSTETANPDSRATPPAESGSIIDMMV